MRHLHRVALGLASALSLTLAAGCGRGENQSAGDVADSLPGPAVGDPAVRDAAGDSLAALRGRQEMADSLGITPAQGIDSAAAAGVRASANDTARNIPGVPDMKPRPGATSGPGARRP